MSTVLGPRPWDSSSTKPRALPKVPSSVSTRKVIPSPLTISSPSSSSVSPHSHLQPPNTTSDPSSSSSSSSKAGRHSIESSRSDLTSVRSDITSLRVSEFPLPPSALPSIPASPKTPTSLNLATPRSQSPQPSFVYQQQHSPGSPGHNERQGSRSPFSDQQYDPLRDEGPSRYSQYAMYKGPNLENISRAATPTTAGTITPRDWPSSGGRDSPLQPPRPAYVTSESPARPLSSLKNGSFASQQEKHHSPDSPLSSRNQSPLPSRSHSPTPGSPRSPSPQPPRSPLPVPPRESARYSHIARHAGVTDMGMDISEEELLSTDFISELLNQQPASSPRSARFLRLPDSPRSATFSHVASDETHGLSGHIGADEIRLAPRQHSTLKSSHFSAPKSISGSDGGLQPPSRYVDDSPGLQMPEMDSPLPSSVYGTEWRQSGMQRSQSGLPSSLFSNGGDRLDRDFPPSPRFTTSPNTQLLTVPSHAPRTHASPHPLVPSTPMSPESFTGAVSPRSPRGFAHAQARHPPAGRWRTSSTGQNLVVHLPIGAAPTSNSTQGVTSPRLPLPRIRQHHYPRHGPAKKDMAQKDQSQGSPQTLQSMTYPPVPSRVSVTPAIRFPSANTVEEEDGLSEPINRSGPGEPKVPVRVTVISNPTSAKSASSSTRTQRDSSPASPRTFGSQDTASGSPGESHYGHSQGASNRCSLGSDIPSSTENDDGSTSHEVEGEVQTASRVWGATSPTIMGADQTTKRTVVGMASAVFVHHNSVEPSEPHEPVVVENPPAHTQDLVHHAGPPDPGASPPPSPNPPSVHSPPSHRTDIPESVKSVGFFTDDAHGTRHLNHLPYSEHTGYGSPNVLWNLNSNGSSNLQPPRSPLSRRSSNKATSFKSISSYLTTRSRASTLASKVSKTSHRSSKSTRSSRWAWLRNKPLPPLPPANQPVNAWRGTTYDTLLKYEAGLQLPDLAQRAGDLRSMLEAGHYPARSKVSLPLPGEPQGWTEDSLPEKGRNWHEDKFGPPGRTLPGFEMLAEDSLKVARRKKPKNATVYGKQNETSVYGSGGGSHTINGRHQSRRSFRGFVALARGNSRKWIWFPIVAVLIFVIILSIALGTTLGRKHSGAASSCSGNTTGAHCNLDATCTCPSSRSNACPAPLARALAQVVPTASQLFATNITEESLAFVLWQSMGTPVGTNCSSQADLINVGSVLDSAVSPNRTQWAQAALLWSLFQTGDIQATKEMLSAIEKLPFKSLSKDGPQTDPSNMFAVLAPGFTFNFASQTVKPPSLTFKTEGSPSSTQVGEVNSAAQISLDRMYSFASASSTQRQNALATYWQSVLSLHLNDLPSFLSVFKSAQILLPFDATASPGGQAITNLLTGQNNKTLSFPPPLGCYPGLSSAQVQRVTAVETQAFGLPALTSSPSNFDPGCFSNRPIYGTLNVLHTRLPFSDSRANVAKQAALLLPDVSSRAILHVGELLSTLPTGNATALSTFAIDPRQFGTLNHLNHIALQWLQSFPNKTMAADAARFVLSSPSLPPSSNSSLFDSAFIPTVEVAIFGNVFLTDISDFVSSFSTPSGALFFGSSQGEAFRRWALQQSAATIFWSTGAFAAQSVHEGSSPDSIFEQIWSGAIDLISKAPGGITGPDEIAKVVNAFNSSDSFI